MRGDVRDVADDREEFIKQLANATGQGNSLAALRAPQNNHQNNHQNTSTGSVRAPSYVAIEDRVRQETYTNVIDILVRGAMKTDSCTWEMVEGSTWDHTLTSHDALEDWIALFNTGLPEGKEASANEKELIKVLHEERGTMTLYRQYLTSNRHDPHKLRNKVQAQQRALQKDDHKEWPQNKLVRIIGQCRNLYGAAESDDGDTRWYVVGLGEVFCPGGDQCTCPSGMIEIKAESVESRWYYNIVHEASVADHSAGGDGERGSERAATRQAPRARKQRQDNLQYLTRVDRMYDGRSPPGVIDLELPFLWPVELIEYDSQGETNLKHGMPRHTSARGHTS